MSFDPSPKVQQLQQRLAAFMDEHIYPNEQRHVEQAETLGPWKVHPVPGPVPARPPAWR